MPRVPVLSNRSVAPIGIPTTQAPTGGVSALQTLGAGVSGAADQVRTLAIADRERADGAVINKAVADLSAWQSDSLLGEGGFYSQRGEAVFKAHEQTRDGWQQQYDQINNGLRSPGQKRAFEDVALRMGSSFGNQLARHEFRERTALEDQSYSARVTASLQTAVGYAHDDAALGLEVAETSETVAAYWRERGAPSEVVEQRVQDFQSSAYGGAIGALLDLGEPQSASALFDDVGEHMTPEDRATISSQIRPALTDSEALAASDEFMVGAGDGEPDDYRSLEAAALKIEDPALRDAFVRRTQKRLGDRSVVARREYGKRFEALHDDVRQARRPINGRERAWLDAGDEKFLDSLFVEMTDPGKRRTDDQLLNTLYDGLPPAERLKVNLNRVVFPITSKADWDKRVADQRRLRDAEATSDQPGTQNRNDFERRLSDQITLLAERFPTLNDEGQVRLKITGRNQFDALYPDGRATPDQQNELLGELSRETLKTSGFDKRLPAGAVLQRDDAEKFFVRDPDGKPQKPDATEALRVQNVLMARERDAGNPNPEVPSAADAELAFQDALTLRDHEMAQALNLAARSVEAPPPPPIPSSFEDVTERGLARRGLPNTAANRFDEFSDIFSALQIGQGVRSSALPEPLRQYALSKGVEIPEGLIHFHALRELGYPEDEARRRAGIPAVMLDAVEALIQPAPEVPRGTIEPPEQDTTPVQSP